MKKPLAFSLGTAALLVASVVLHRFFGPASPPQQAAPAPPTPAASRKPSVPVPDLGLLMQQASQNAALHVPESTGSDPLENLQISAAAEDLQSPDIDTRVGGAEQLAAYPSPRSERLLVEALQTDLESPVRTEAATSLRQIRHPKPETIAALVESLVDDAEEVQQAALDTLANHIQNLDSDSKSYRKLVATLRKKLTSRKLAANVREDLKVLLDDQYSG